MAEARLAEVDVGIDYPREEEVPGGVEVVVALEAAADGVDGVAVQAHVDVPAVREGRIPDDSHTEAVGRVGLNPPDFHAGLLAGYFSEEILAALGGGTHLLCAHQEDGTITESWVLTE